MGNRLRLVEERLMEMLYSPVSMRLVHFLLGNVDPDSGVLTDVSHEEIGDIIGAVRQTVTEALSHVRKQGLILTGQKWVQIIDRQGLEEIARGSESRFIPDFTI
ncbi:Crp/Fnr family transcriptional regulator [Chloroflexota bacterium]